MQTNELGRKTAKDVLIYNDISSLRHGNLDVKSIKFLLNKQQQ